MKPAEYRKSRGLSQSQFGTELGLAEGSKGYVSRLERGETRWPLKLALRLERLSAGEVPAATICPEAAELQADEARA